MIRILILAVGFVCAVLAGALVSLHCLLVLIGQ